MSKHTGGGRRIGAVPPGTTPPKYVLRPAATPAAEPGLDAIDAALEFVIDHLDGFHTGECRCRQRIEAIRARLSRVPAPEEKRGLSEAFVRAKGTPDA